MSTNPYKGIPYIGQYILEREYQKHVVFWNDMRAGEDSEEQMRIYESNEVYFQQQLDLVKEAMS